MVQLLRPRASLSTSTGPGGFKPYFDRMKPQLYSDPNQTRGSSNSLRTIAWNPLGSLIATGSADKTLRVWNPERAQVKFSTELKGHSASIEKVAFNPVKDAELCSVSIDGVVKFWDVRNKKCFNEVRGLGEAFTLTWAPDGETLIVGNKDDNIYVLSPTSSTPLSEHQQDMQTNQIAFCWSGEKVFVTTGDGKIRVLSYPDFEPIWRRPWDDDEEAMLSGHTSSCLSVELQPIARYLATGGSDSTIALWDTQDWLCQRTITSMVGPVRSLSWTFDGSYVVGGSDEGTGLDVTHAETGENVYHFKTAGSCPIVAWAPTRYQLAYADAGSLRIVGVDVDRR